MEIVGEYIIAHLSAAEAFIYLFMTAAAFVLIPRMYQTYQKWKATQKGTDFSSFMLHGILSLFFFASTYPLFASHAIKLDSAIGNYRIIAISVLLLLASTVFLPKMLSCYQRLKNKKSAGSFTLMCFYAWLSFNSIFALFATILNAAISSVR